MSAHVLHSLLCLAVIVVSHHVPPASSSLATPDMLTIAPPRPRVGDRATFQCTLAEVCEFIEGMPRAFVDRVTFVNISLYRWAPRSRSPNVLLATQDADCSSGGVVRSSVNVVNASLAAPSCCGSMTLENVIVNESMDGEYLCDVEMKKLGNVHRYTSKTARLAEIGQSNFTVTRFTLTDADTGAPIDPDSSVAAGTSVIAVCETETAGPPPPVVAVSVTGGGPAVLSQPPFDSRVELLAIVPRRPLVEFVCQVFDGIGEPLVERLAIQSVYGPVRSEMQMLQQANSRNRYEELLCSITNNPPRPIVVSGLDEAVATLRFSQQPGLSVAYAKFNASREDRLMTFTCGVNGSAPLRGVLRLFGSNCTSFWCT